MSFFFEFFKTKLVVLRIIIKIKIDGKKVTPSKHVKYLGIYIDNHLSWNYQEQDLRSRLSRAAGMLCKIRHYVSFDTLKMVYNGIFSSILTYGSLIWGQHDRIVNRLQKVQNRAIRYINFKPKRYPSSDLPALYFHSEILMLKDFLTLQNCLFAFDSINANLPPPLLDERIAFVHTSGNTRSERLNHLENFRTRTVLYGSRSINSMAVSAWNSINTELHELKLQNSSRTKCKEEVSKLLLNTYDTNA